MQDKKNIDKFFCVFQAGEILRKKKARVGAISKKHIMEE
jgi:hypothetical protein